MAFAEYDRHDGLGLAALVKKGSITPLEVVDEAIARAERLNPHLNAVVFKDYDRARDAAKAMTPHGIFAGVPTLLKDMRAAATGMPTRSGSRMMPPIPSKHDSTLVARYRANGLIPLGKTNVPEFGIVPTTEGLLYGAAHNPWDLDHTPGGSSGGSAAAVAAGIVPIAHATDGGGSIRIPASNCGLVGLKVSRGRITQGPDAADATTGLSVDHCVTRTVRDCAAMLDFASVADFGDPYFAPPPPDSYLIAIEQKPKRLKIAVALKGLDGKPFSAEVTQAIQNAATLCAELGHHVDEASLSVNAEEMTMAFMTLWASNVAYGVDALARMTGTKPSLDLLEGLTMGLYDRGKALTAVHQIWAQQTLFRAARVAASFHQTYDLWLTPTLSQLPLKLGIVDVNDQDVEEAFAPILGYVPFTAMQNGTGQPAINLPLHWSKSGLPVGVQFVARNGDEVTLLKLAAEIEAAHPWFDKRPKL
jgi:amidase